MVFEIELRVFASLPDAFLAVAIPGARLLDDAGFRRDVHEQRFVTDALVEHDVELGLTERRRDFVLYHLDAQAVADHHLALFSWADASPVEAHRHVEHERPATRSGFGDS